MDENLRKERESLNRRSGRKAAPNLDTTDRAQPAPGLDAVKERERRERGERK